MTVQLPTELPRWADVPPAPPPTTITQPSEPEKDVGFQPGTQAQVEDFLIVNVINNHTYNATINGVVASYLSDGTATSAEIVAGLVAAVNGLGQPVTATNLDPYVRVTANVAGQAFAPTTTDGANITIIHVFANRSNKPIRQYLNWLFNRGYQWILFWFYTMFSWDDVGGVMDVLNKGVLPPTAITLVGNSGSAVSYVRTTGGDPTLNRRAVGVLETHTYTASRDTYVDLNFDGSWTYTAVPNGDPAPALNVLRRRQWMVRTSGSAITAVTDLRTGNVLLSRLWNFLDTITLGHLSGDNPKIQTVVGDIFHAYDFLGYAAGVVGQDVRVYNIVSGGGIAIACGCRWDRATEAWFFDATALTSNPSQASLVILNYGGSGRMFALTKSVVGADAATTWNDNTAGDYLAAGCWTDMLTGNLGRLRLGEGLLHSAAQSLLARVTVNKAANGTSPRTLLLEDIAGANTLRIYLSNAGASGGIAIGACIEIVENAFWVTGAPGHWARDVSGASTKTEIGAGGVRILHANAATFTDVLDNGSNLSLSWQVSTATDIVREGYEVKGVVTPDGAGGFAVQAGAGATYAFSGSQIRVTLARPMPDTNYVVVGNASLTLSSTGLGIGFQVQDASHFLISVTDTPTDAAVNLSTTANIRITFIATPTGV